MSYADAKTVVLRASNNQDPTVAGYRELRLAILSCEPRRPPTGKQTEYWNGRKKRPKRRRPTFDIRCLGFTREAGTASSTLMDFGHFTFLEDMVTIFDHLWLYATYESGSDTSAGPLLRAGAHDTATTGTNSSWTTDYVLPMEVTLIDALQPTMNDDGTYDLEFSLEAVAVQ